ncbi:MAG: methionine--tRNA ligase [Candidatus Omnitrophica bacterium]|nr:methionine--tRNA ligase [Candidatus Omnitrophota bacterium]
MKFYITTPLYYINAEPHIGHAYTTIAADALARFYRMADYDVFFLTGTDEHGQKIAEAAKKQGVSPQQLADKNSETYKKLWKNLGISYTRFIRTTESSHEKVVEKVFRKLLEKGDLYKGEYTGHYCVPCEGYYIPEDEDSPLCPDCKRPMNKISEPSYFFRISKYAGRLRKYIEEHEFVKPDFRKNEVLNLIKSGVCDVSITRKNVEWGIVSPTPEKYTVYVWFDALLNYLSGIGYLHDEGLFEKYWPANVQLMAKDIIRFHNVIWPCMLMALDLPLPETIFAHGWWITGKEKISKSKGNAVSPGKIIEEYGVDALRFFLLREVPFGLDGEYSDETFKKRYNSDLVNDLGNLVNRTVNLVETKLSGTVAYSDTDNGLAEISAAAYENYEAKMKALALSEALEEAWKLVSALNKFLDEKAPWREGSTGVKQVLYSTVSGIRDCAIMLAPFIPESSLKIWRILGLPGDPCEYNFAALREKLPDGLTTQKREILFPRKK